MTALQMQKQAGKGNGSREFSLELGAGEQRPSGSPATQTLLGLPPLWAARGSGALQSSDRQVNILLSEPNLRTWSLRCQPASYEGGESHKICEGLVVCLLIKDFLSPLIYWHVTKLEIPSSVTWARDVSKRPPWKIPRRWWRQWASGSL